MKTQLQPNRSTVKTVQPDTKNQFEGKQVTVVGLGRAGLACALLCRLKGALVFVTEQAADESLRPATETLEERGIVFELGGHTDRAVTDSELVIVSPGVPLDLPILKLARERGLPIISEIEAAYLVSEVPVLAVTGSNGKTTTTTWLGEIYRAAGLTIEVAGNIGRPYADAVLNNPTAERYVLEISSFQLETIKTFAPKVAVILNVSPDHLDRHQSVENYAQIKYRLFARQQPTDVAIKNFDDPLLVSQDLPGQAIQLGFSLTQQLETGIWLSEDQLKYSLPTAAGSLIGVNEIGLPGRHNLANAAAAGLAALVDGIDPEAIRTALREFTGVEHRLEFVAEIDGVRYVNDSKATNPDAVHVALAAMSSPVILIMGGLDKGCEFSPLAEQFAGRVRRLICTGKAAELIAGQLSSAAGTMIIRDFVPAVEAAQKAARPGDTVLLSPGCASFDSFKNYEERGRVFKDVVNSFKK